jgi:hypothetical protein
LRDLRSKDPRPRPAPPSRVNGCLGLALARGIFSPSSRCFVRIGDPIRPLPRARPLSRPRPREAKRASAVSPTHEAPARAPSPRRVAPRSFRSTAPRAARTASFPKPSASGGVPASRRSLRPRSFGSLRIRAHATLAISPSPSSTDPPVVDG